MQSSHSSSFPSSTSPSSIVPPDIPVKRRSDSLDIISKRLREKSLRPSIYSTSPPQGAPATNLPGAWIHSAQQSYPYRAPMHQAYGLLDKQNKFRLQQHESRCLQMVYPGVYLAFADDEASFKPTTAKNLTTLARGEALKALDGQEFTHVVQLVHLPEDMRIRVPSAQRFLLKGVKYLRLTLPPPPPFGYHPYEDYVCRNNQSLTDEQNEPGMINARARYFASLDSQSEDGPHLTPEQYLIARDFLASSGFQLDGDSQVKILITTPRDDRTDAVCLAALWLAHKSSYRINDILTHIDSSSDPRRNCLRLGSVWKIPVGEGWRTDLQRLVWMKCP